jgi:hypothetical protein
MGPENPHGDEHERPPKFDETMWIGPVTDMGPDAVAFLHDLRRGPELNELIAASPLLKILPVARSVSVKGVVVEMLALEVRAAGIRAWFRFDSADSPRGPVGFPVATVYDHDGTAYEAATQPGPRFRSGGEASVFVVPRPPDPVSALTVAVTRFIAPPGAPPPAPQLPFKAVEGPWEFEIELDA